MTSVSTDRRLGVNSGAAIKVPCRAASTGNLTLSGEQTIDGVACVTGDRVLVKNQTSTSENGIYIVDTGTWGRSPDWDGSYDVLTGTLVTATAGTTNANTVWRVSTTGTITIGTTGVDFASAVFSDASTVLFTQASIVAANLATRTMQDKMREGWISVKDAKVTGGGQVLGNGVQDDTSGIQAAINTGKNIFFPAGTYKITSALTFSTIGQVIFGASMELTEIVLTGAINGFVSSGALVRCHFRDLKITGANTTLNAIDCSSGTLYESSFKNLVIYTGGKSIYAPTEFNNVYENVQFSSYNDNGLELAGGTYTTLISCYAHTFAVGKIPYRLYGGAVMMGCNGVDTGDYIVLAGKAVAKGDATNVQYRLLVLGGNFEDFKKNAIQLRYEGTYAIHHATFLPPAVVTSATYDACLWIEANSLGGQIFGGSVASKGAVRNKLADIYSEAGSPPLCFGTGGSFGTTWDSAGTLTVIPNLTAAQAAFAIYGVSAANFVMGRGYGFYSPAQTTWTANSATFSVTSIDRVKTANTVPTSFTNATGGVDGQELTIFVTDANTTIQHNVGGAGRFMLPQAVDIACTTGEAYHFVWDAAAQVWRWNSGLARRARQLQGATVASANNLALGDDGSRFQISGATQVNLLDSTRWWGGAIVTLHFQGAPTVKHNQGASGANKPIMLAGAADFVASANDQLTVQYDSTDSKWYQLATAVI